MAIYCNEKYYIIKFVSFLLITVKIWPFSSVFKIPYFIKLSVVFVFCCCCFLFVLFVLFVCFCGFLSLLCV